MRIRSISRSNIRTPLGSPSGRAVTEGDLEGIAPQVPLSVSIFMGAVLCQHTH